MNTSGGSQNLDPYGSSLAGQPNQAISGLGQPISGQAVVPPVPVGPVAANPNIQSGGMVGQFGQPDLSQPIGQSVPVGQVAPQDFSQPQAQTFPPQVQPVLAQPQAQTFPPQVQPVGQIPVVIPPQPPAVPIQPEPVSIPAGRPSGVKEAEYVGGGGSNISEYVPIIEVKEPGELPPEVEGWIERTEHDEVKDFQPVVHDGQVLVSTPAAQVAGVILPLTEEEMKKGAHQKLYESMRWMAEWCFKMIKQYHAKIVYGGEKTVK